MRARDILTEATFNPEIKHDLISKGYRPLGKGQDQYAFLEPGTGLVLKIFGTSSKGSQSPELTKAQRSFKIFADYCAANPNNPFLPQVYGWEKFIYEGFVYLQIRIERMFPFSGLGDMAELLEAMSDDTGNGNNTRERREAFVDQYLKYAADEGAPELFTNLGDEIDLLWKALYDLRDIADTEGYVLDLHSGNFMLGSDSHIVISDPFFLGWGKS